jgi:hypothetical protein
VPPDKLGRAMALEKSTLRRTPSDVGTGKARLLNLYE